MSSTLPTILHLGAEHQVTGSCHLLRANGLNIMVDCGSAQGGDSVIPMKDWPVLPSEVDYLFLTHAHIDHVGRVPEMVEQGFNGEIITTQPTKALLEPMLMDSMTFSVMSEERIRELEKTIDDLSWGFEYQQKFDLKNGVKFTLYRAGHILGSCFIRFEAKDPGWSVIFSGDLGGKNRPILCDPDVPEPCDVLILESTYGDEIHDSEKQRTMTLGTVLESALNDGGKVFIPAFALGRTQELIYEMDRLFSDSRYSRKFPMLNSRSAIPVIIDSPLGLKVTKIYSELSEYWDREAKNLLYKGDHPIDFDHLYAVRDYKDHQRLMDMGGPAIIIAGSGMCTGGRIVEHLITGLEDPLNDVFFVGYQAHGTPGRDIMKYGSRSDGYVYLDGKKVFIRAKIHSLSGYSAHADQKGLVEWVESMPGKPGKIKLVHGEPEAQRALAEVLEKKEYNVCNSSGG